jgi:hypothetical protein
MVGWNRKDADRWGSQPNFKKLPWHLPVRTEENCENLSQDSWCLGLELNNPKHLCSDDLNIRYRPAVQLWGRNPKNTWRHCHHWLVSAQSGAPTYEISSRAPRCHQPSWQTPAPITSCRDLYRRSLSLTLKKAAQISALGTRSRWCPVFLFSWSSDRVVKIRHVRGSVSGSYIIVIILSSVRLGKWFLYHRHHTFQCEAQ